MAEPKFIPYSDYKEYPEDEMKVRARDFHEEMKRRRTVRFFSERAVPPEVIEDCIRAAGTAPSGANMQPWRFVVVSDPGLKTRVREAAEEEEHEFYANRATPEWLEALKPLGTDEHKPYLETAPYLIVVFRESYGLLPDGAKVKHYYSSESVGIATGFLLSALHHAGVATLTHTPSPMNFLNDILGRPENEKPFLIVVAGFPAKDAVVPDIHRKDLKDIAVFL